MAYILGFFTADGSMIRNRRGAHFVEFNITDRSILEQIKMAMGSTHKISSRDRGNDRWKLGYRLQFGSKILFEDLHNLGLVQRKSKILRLPKIPRKWVGSFVRGYFDGDGCVYFKQHLIRGRKKPKWIFNSRFTSGSRAFLQQLHALLAEHGVSRGFILNKQRGFDLVLSHRDSVALYHLMYDNRPRIYLKRKYRIFRRALKTLYGYD
jgi:intein/homing endonuclease